jgi:son of sevenless-like protein
VEQLRLHGMEAVARVSSFLVFVADIHVARHIDIDGIGQEANISSAAYMQTIDNARVLVRTLEAVFQSVHDDCATLLLTIQSVRDSEAGQEWRDTYEYLDALSSSLGSNLSLIVQTFDSLLSIGHDQAEMAVGEYTGSIDWRMSRVSMRPLADSTAIPAAGPADMVGIEHVFSNQSINIPNGEGSSSQPHNRNLSTELDRRNASDTTEESLVEENPPNGVVHDVNSSPLFEDDGMFHPHPRIFLLSGRSFVVAQNQTPPRGGTASKKLARLLGEEYEEQVVAADLRPWYLRSNFNPSEILIDTDNSVKGGTLPALVERLTAHEAAGEAMFILIFYGMTFTPSRYDLHGIYQILPYDLQVVHNSRRVV